MRIEIVFGATAPTLAKQLGLSKNRTAMVQRSADSIVWLKVRGLLTDAECDRVRRRLMRDIMFLVPPKADDQAETTPA